MAQRERRGTTVCGEAFLGEGVAPELKEASTSKWASYAGRMRLKESTRTMIISVFGIISDVIWPKEKFCNRRWAGKDGLLFEEGL